MASVTWEALGDSLVESFLGRCVLGREASVWSRQLCNFSGVERILSTEKDECTLLLAAEVPPFRMTPSRWELVSLACDKGRALRGADADDAARRSFGSKSKGPLVIAPSFLLPPAVAAVPFEAGVADTHWSSV